MLDPIEYLAPMTIEDMEIGLIENLINAEAIDENRLPILYEIYCNAAMIYGDEIYRRRYSDSHCTT